MPIVLSQDEWARIGKWADHDKEDPETIRRREYIQFLDNTSRVMTKSWPNSLENVNKRNEELRRARLDAAEAANTNFYKSYVRKKKEEQERLMYSARDTIFKNKDAPKLLLGAVIETVVQKERIEQLKFQKEQRRLQEEQKRRDDDDIIRRAKEWNELVELKKTRRFEVNKQHQKQILEQAHEVTERNRIEHETELNLQKIDNIQAKKQMEAIEKFEEDFKAAEKARIWSDMERSRREAAARRRERAACDRLDERLTRVLAAARAALHRRRNHTEHEIRQEKLRVLEKMSLKLESGDAARDSKEQAILDKAIREKEATAEARRQADIRKKEEFKEQRAQTRRDFLRDEAQRLHELDTTRQWDIMNRFKNAELYEEFQDNLRREKAKKIKEYREELLRLWEERDARLASERAHERYVCGEVAARRQRAQDNQILAHAAGLLAEAARHHRPAHALRRATHRYCKMYRLYPMPELPSSMQEHFATYQPWDGSKPDPGYTEPPPPPVEQIDQWGLPVSSHHDGLQPVQQAGPSKPVDEPKEDKEKGDYKRIGRANGLQRRPGQVDINLPPISAVPCKTEDCRCELKP